MDGFYAARMNATHCCGATFRHFQAPHALNRLDRHVGEASCARVCRQVRTENCTCFKCFGESIKSRAAMRIAQQTFVWPLLPLEILGYPYMKLNVALAASIAALALMTACSKQEAAAPEAAPAADAAAASADAAAASADAAASSADAAATAPAPADAAAAPADAAAAPADAPAEAPKQ
jgi:hypothetical protein